MSDGDVDERLVRRYVDEGDQRAFEELVARHQSKVFGLSLSILGNRQDALDAVQDTFISVYKSLSSFQHRSAFSTWLYRLTVNCCRDSGRRKARTPQPAEALEVPAPDGLAQADLQMTVRNALAQLGPEQRTAVVMRDMYQMTYEEIAQACDVPVGTVRSRIARARSALGEVLGREASLGPGVHKQGNSPAGPAV